MQRSLSLLLKRSIVLSTFAASGCIVLFVTLGLVQSASTQVTKRSLESKIPPHVPIKIKIKKEKEEKALDLDNKNWFRDIEIELTNSSDKPIYFLSLFVAMPDLPQDRPGVNRVFLLGYGRGDFIETEYKTNT
jgi:glycerophosphoryl diester phosphodiesterase